MLMQKLCLVLANSILDSKRSVIEAKIESNGELGDATVFEHFLANDNLTIEEIYTNMTELLLSGVDTVSINSYIYYLNHSCSC